MFCLASTVAEPSKNSETDPPRLAEATGRKNPADAYHGEERAARNAGARRRRLPHGGDGVGEKLSAPPHAVGATTTIGGRGSSPERQQLFR